MLSTSEHPESAALHSGRMAVPLSGTGFDLEPCNLASLDSQHEDQTASQLGKGQRPPKSCLTSAQSCLGFPTIGVTLNRQEHAHISHSHSYANSTARELADW